MLIKDAIRLLAKIVNNSAFARRVVARNVITEPECTRMGSDSVRDPNDGPNIGAATHQEMETFVLEVTKAVHEESVVNFTLGNCT